jgi:hypothetical protein
MKTWTNKLEVSFVETAEFCVVPSARRSIRDKRRGENAA